MFSLKRNISLIKFELKFQLRLDSAYHWFNMPERKMFILKFIELGLHVHNEIAQTTYQSGLLLESLTLRCQRFLTPEFAMVTFCSANSAHTSCADHLGSGLGIEYNGQEKKM